MNISDYFEFQLNMVTREMGAASEFPVNLARETARITESIACYIFSYSKEERNTQIVHKYMDESVTVYKLCDSIICNFACNPGITEQILGDKIFIPEECRSTISGYKFNTCFIPINQDEKDMIYVALGRATAEYTPDQLLMIRKTIAVLWHFYKKVLESDNMRIINGRLMEESKREDEYVRNIAYALRPPVNAVSGFSNLISETENLSYNGKKYIGIISECSEELVSIISNFEKHLYNKDIIVEKQINSQINNDYPISHFPSGFKTILAVEDDDVVFLLIRQFLKDSEFNIVRSVNGQEALNYCFSARPDLILMDIMMPVMDGFEATKQIKKIHPEMKIIAQTAYISEKEKIIDCGCIDIIIKPYEKQQLISIINSYI